MHGYYYSTNRAVWKEDFPTIPHRAVDGKR